MEMLQGPTSGTLEANYAKEVEPAAHRLLSLDNITYEISDSDIRHHGETQRRGREKERGRVCWWGVEVSLTGAAPEAGERQGCWSLKNNAMQERLTDKIW